MEHVSRSEAAVEAAVLVRVLDVESWFFAPVIVADPASIAFHTRGFAMRFTAVFLAFALFHMSLCGRWAVGRDVLVLVLVFVLAVRFVAAALLRLCGHQKRNREPDCESGDCFHTDSGASYSNQHATL